MDKLKYNDEILDQIYDLCEELMYYEKWNVLSMILEYITQNAWKYDGTILCGWATATLRGRYLIKSRPNFLKECRKLYSNEEIWKGLD